MVLSITLSITLSIFDRNTLQGAKPIEEHQNLRASIQLWNLLLTKLFEFSLEFRLYITASRTVESETVWRRP